MYPGRTDNPTTQVRLYGDDWNAMRDLAGQAGRAEVGGPLSAEKNAAGHTVHLAHHVPLPEVVVNVIGYQASAFGSSGSDPSSTLTDAPAGCYYGYVCEEAATHIDLTQYAQTAISGVQLAVDMTSTIRRVLFIDQEATRAPTAGPSDHSGLIEAATHIARGRVLNATVKDHPELLVVAGAFTRKQPTSPYQTDTTQDDTLARSWSEPLWS